jgi:hypothetical protein
MRRLVLRQRYFTDICSIAVVTLAVFQRSVMDLKKCGKLIKRKQLAIQHTPAILFGYHLLSPPSKSNRAAHAYYCKAGGVENPAKILSYFLFETSVM